MPNRNKNEALWFKDAVIYQLHVRAFYDSNDDGIGDFPGLIQKLDYLSELGVTAIWLLPFYPSPLKDDGYDIADYTQINPAYGTLKDFRKFLNEAHARGIRVITELVINHTSDQHEWFQKSRRAPQGSYWRDFYVWSDDPNKYKGVRIIFKDFEPSNWTWDPVAKSYYWHRFYSHQPDLNFDNPEVHKAVFQALDFWMEMGVDGLRLDAVPYLFEREGTSCENLPETHEFLKKLRAHVESRYPGRMLLAEANQWPEDAVAYFGDGDECHMNFHFPLMPRLFMALKMEDRYSIIDILKQTPEIPENCQWATFLRNHDELTLEMVTDEERDYMYRVYASDPRARINLGVRRRLAPLMQGDRRQIELLNSLLFSLPGSPIIYYGDEIGMGDNIYLGDRDGVRTPFQWSPDRNAGFSKANPQRLYLPVITSPEYHSEAINVETQHGNSNSMLWWTHKLIALRKTYPELSRGKLEFVDSNNPKVLTFVREHEGQAIVCVANLSRSVQFVELDLSRFKGTVPVELFGKTDFPPVGDLAYFLTLSPYAFYWFQMVDKSSLDTGQWLMRQSTPIKIGREPLQALSNRSLWRHFELGFKNYLPRMRWFTGKDRRIATVNLDDNFPVRHFEGKGESVVALLNVTFREGLPEQYLVSLSYAEGDRARRIREAHPELVVAEAVRGLSGDAPESGIYYDAILDGAFHQAILSSVLNNESMDTAKGRIDPETVRTVSEEELQVMPDPTLSGLEQSNSSVIFGKRFYLKLYRRIEEGENPEIEVGRYLTSKEFKGAAPLIGSLSYRRGTKRYSLGIVQEVVESQTDGWSLMVSQVGTIAEQALATPEIASEMRMPSGTFGDLRRAQPPEALKQIGGYSFVLVRQLAQKTAEMHRALAEDDRNPAFIPEPFTPFHQRSLFQSYRNLTVKVMNLLKSTASQLDEATRDLAEQVLHSENEIFEKFGWIKTETVEAPRIRIHGDYHLGQVLFTGEDFYIVDFEGEPARGLGERKLKRSPMKDIAGMLRSFDYAAEYYLKEKTLVEDDWARLSVPLKTWAAWASIEYVNAYLDAMEETNLLPKSFRQIESLLSIFTLEKALYEVFYEMSSRPHWVDIPLRGVLSTLGRSMDTFHPTLPGRSET